jgi:hypothetical protein
VLALVAALATLSVLAGPASAQQPAASPPTVIDGPTAAIPAPSGLGLSIARDGTGGLVYLKQVSGVTHVFVSTLQGGSFQAPTQVDAALGGASSQPVIAAGQDGLLLIGFINGGELYVVGRASEGAAFSSPAGLAAGASNPAISMTDFGKAYVAFTVADGSGYDVRTGYYDNGRWALESPSLNVAPADNAGTGGGAPQVVAAGDGVAIVVWGESGHIFSRRVWATSPSAAVEQADAPPSGCTEQSADSPVVGAGGDSSYAQVAFHEVVTCNSQEQSRVFMNLLQGSVYDGLKAADGLSNRSTDGAGDPQIAMTEYGHGWVTSEYATAHDIFATAMGDNGSPAGTVQVNGLSNRAAPDPVPAIAGLYSDFIVWQQDPGSDGLPELRVRYAPANSALGPEMVISTPAQGPTYAAGGLAAAGDVSGDAAAAWLQGGPGATWVMAEQMYQPPGPIFVSKAVRYENSANSLLQWSAAHEPWGPMTYTVSVDGTQVAQTNSTAVRVPATVADGPHGWQVSGANPAGQTTHSATASVFLDTVPPTAAMTLYGRPRPATKLHVYVSYADLPPAGEPPSDASGVRSVVVRWGDGTTVPLKLGFHRSFHTYRRAGHYVISLLVTDRAGNVTRQVIRVTIAKTKPKGKSKQPTAKPASGKQQGTGSDGVHAQNTRLAVAVGKRG